MQNFILMENLIIKLKSEFVSGYEEKTKFVGLAIENTMITGHFKRPGNGITCFYRFFFLVTFPTWPHLWFYFEYGQMIQLKPMKIAYLFH